MTTCGVGTACTTVLVVGVIALVIVMALDLSCKSSSQRTLQVKNFRYFLVVKYVLRRRKVKDKRSISKEFI